MALRQITSVLPGPCNLTGSSATKPVPALDFFFPRGVSLESFYKVNGHLVLCMCGDDTALLGGVLHTLYTLSINISPNFNPNMRR